MTISDTDRIAAAKKGWVTRRSGGITVSVPEYSKPSSAEEALTAIIGGREKEKQERDLKFKADKWARTKKYAVRRAMTNMLYKMKDAAMNRDAKGYLRMRRKLGASMRLLSYIDELRKGL